MPRPDPHLTGQSVELLQALIRNACVNDGTPTSGEEIRNADLLAGFLAGMDVERYEPASGRSSLLATIEGSDSTAPTLLLLGHTDVVPVSSDEWREDPFGGELIDGEVWGRGAVDMLNLTSSMAVAVRELHRRGWRPRGTLKYLAVADEEAGGTLGAGWLTEHRWDDVAADLVLTESGGIPIDTPTGAKLVFAVAEKGIGWRRLTVRGTPGHGSMPWGADNAVLVAAEVVRRIQDYQPRAQLGERWEAWVDGLGLPGAERALLLDPVRIREGLERMDPRRARYCHAATHTTFSPNVIHGGTKSNVIPDRVDIEIDIRTLPGVGAEDVDVMLAEALGDLIERVEVTRTHERDATASPADTPLFDALRRGAKVAHPTAEILPWTIVGGTDAAFFRERGATAYGAGMFSSDVRLEDFALRFHGHDERIDVDSLGLSTQLWLDVAADVLG